MSSSPSSRWFAGSNVERQTLEKFQVLLYGCILPIEEVYSTLEKASLPFNTKDILPFHCRKAIKILSQLNMQLTPCCQLLRETATLPLVVLALRYQLLDELHYIMEQSDNLVSFLDSYLSMYMKSSYNLTELERAIQELFEKLLYLVSHVPMQTTFLLNEARFQEKRLALLPPT